MKYPTTSSRAKRAWEAVRDGSMETLGLVVLSGCIVVMVCTRKGRAALGELFEGGDEFGPDYNPHG